MNIGIESRNHDIRRKEMHTNVECYLLNGKKKTIKFIQNNYGYTIPAAARYYRENFG